MEAIKKQATRLREQVAKQQQAVLKHLGHFGHESIIIDEDELHCYQQLQNLYNTTRAAKHFQRNVVRGIDAFISVSSKQMEIAKKLADDCCKYGTDGQCTNSFVARASVQFGTSHSSMEKERETLLGILGDQVSEPLRAMITGAPLEDARHLTHRYDKIRQEVEAQAAEVVRRRTKTRDYDITAESCSRLRAAEARLNELKNTMRALGREATAAMLSVEDQQQEVTLQRLFTMVDAEKCYHQHVMDILDKLHAEMIIEEQSLESESPTAHNGMNVPPAQEDTNSHGSHNLIQNGQKDAFFLARVVHPFDAQAEGELSLSVGDYVVVRQVASTGWSEGECQGRAGWFPSAYVERQDMAPASKMIEASSTG